MGSLLLLPWIATDMWDRSQNRLPTCQRVTQTPKDTWPGLGLRPFKRRHRRAGLLLPPLAVTSKGLFSWQIFLILGTVVLSFVFDN